VDAWAGPRSERLRLSPGNVRADACRVLDRGAWEAMLARPESEVRSALESGDLVLEELSTDEAAALEARS
jgi:hypothetical protein